MTIVRRDDFSGPADLRAMQQFASRVWTPTSRFHPGQLAWSRHYQQVDPLRPAPGEAIALWREDGRVVGFGWAETDDWLEVQVQDDRPDVAEAVLEWFEDWSDADDQAVLTMAGGALDAALTEAGFVAEDDEPWFTHHVRPTEGLPPVPDVAGYRLRSMVGAGPDDVAARAACHAAAWAEFGPSPVTTEAYAALMDVWPYDPALDWVAVDADGAMVASCLVWLDPATGVGLVEPVGCVPEHRGHGLAGAVTLAALHRLRELGGHTALVSPRGDDGHPGPQRLYRALGFEPSARTRTWTRSRRDAVIVADPTTRVPS
ncbi:MAG: GNAT family N-acetyltransferase [Terracoccus sp.]